MLAPFLGKRIGGVTKNGISVRFSSLCGGIRWGECPHEPLLAESHPFSKRLAGTLTPPANTFTKA